MKSGYREKGVTDAQVDLTEQLMQRARTDGDWHRAVISAAVNLIADHGIDHGLSAKVASGPFVAAVKRATAAKRRTAH